MQNFDNERAWKNAFDSMFGAIQMRDCTPETILQTMHEMARASNRLQDIVIAARSRNIAAGDDTTLECLRTLYKQGKIQHRENAGSHLFIRNKS